MHRKQKGQTAFREYYQSLFKDSWPAINASLYQRSPLLIALHPEYANHIKSHFRDNDLSIHLWNHHPLILHWPPEAIKGIMLPGIADGYAYALSEASVYAAMSFDVSVDRVLDACAAPGGKAFVLASKIWGSQTELVVNDVSPDRVKRLKASLRRFPNLSITTQAAERLRISSVGKFDRILLDTPCSSEAHVVRSPLHLKKWSLSRVKELTNRQRLLVDSLGTLLNPGGRLRYVTCALNVSENEDQIQWLISNGWTLRDLGKSPWKNREGDLPRLNGTWRCWPHLEQTGPLFVAELEPDSDQVL